MKLSKMLQKTTPYNFEVHLRQEEDYMLERDDYPIYAVGQNQL